MSNKSIVAFLKERRAIDLASAVQWSEVVAACGQASADAHRNHGINNGWIQCENIALLKADLTAAYPKSDTRERDIEERDRLRVWLGTSEVQKLKDEDQAREKATLDLHNARQTKKEKSGVVGWFNRYQGVIRTVMLLASGSAGTLIVQQTGCSKPDPPAVVAPAPASVGPATEQPQAKRLFVPRDSIGDSL